VVHSTWWHLVEACWLAWLALWAVMAVFTKRTAERPEIAWSLGSSVILGIAFVVVRFGSHSSTGQLYGVSGTLGALCVATVALGLAFTAWARFSLGGNWSGAIVIKEGHELIESGPYSFVRHPIYTGLLTMLLASFVLYARPLGFVAFGLACAALWGKLLREERLMTEHFPDAYDDYRRRTKAIVPFIY
jgi:protein-S-isoprenylcysteine O-methyltransferase Ste14